MRKVRIIAAFGAFAASMAMLGTVQRRRFAQQSRGDTQLLADAIVNSKVPSVGEGQYDVRRGAAGYSPIVAAFGALGVPAIVLIFTFASEKIRSDPNLIVLAIGLLVIGMVGSLLGAFALAAIAAEGAPTANLAATVMYAAVPVVLSIVSTLAAFEVLCAIYVPHSRTLFALIVAAVGLFGVIFNAFAIADSVALGPRDVGYFGEWVQKQSIQTLAQGYRWARCVAIVASVPILVATGTRLVGLSIVLSASGTEWVIGGGMAMVLAGTLASVLRSAHPSEGNDQRGLRLHEAFGSCLAISAYVILLLSVLP